MSDLWAFFRITSLYFPNNLYRFAFKIQLHDYERELAKTEFIGRPLPGQPRDQYSMYHQYTPIERKFIRIFLKNTHDHWIYHNSVGDEWIPNFFYSFPKNAVIHTSPESFQLRIFGIQIDLSICDFPQSFARMMLDLPYLRRIRIYHPNYRRIFESIPKDLILDEMGSDRRFFTLHRDCGFRQFMYHRMLPTHDFEGFTNLLDYFIENQIWKDYGISVLELKSHLDFPSTTDIIGWSTDPTSQYFPRTAEYATYLDRKNEEMNRKVEEFRNRFRK